MGTDKNIKLHIVTDIKPQRHLTIGRRFAFKTQRNTMQFPLAMMHDRIWIDRLSYIEAEEHHRKKVTNANESSVPDEIGSMGETITMSQSNVATSHSAEAAATSKNSDDDDFDIFGDDDDDEEEEETEEERKKKEELLTQYNLKKSQKPVLIAKSNIVLDVKPWDDETDLAEMERLVRTIEMDGLLWGNSKLVPVGYGIRKLQISCVVEDEKVGSEILDEEITKFEDYVQSVDIAAFNKI